MTFYLNVDAFYQNDLIGIYLGTIFFLIYLIIFQLSPLEYNYFLNNRNVVTFEGPVEPWVATTLQSKVSP